MSEAGIDLAYTCMYTLHVSADYMFTFIIIPHYNIMETLFNKPLLKEQRMDAAHIFFVNVSDLLHQNRNCSIFALRRGVAVGVL